MTTTLSTICKKRLLGDIKLLKKDPHKYIDVSPDEHDLLTWYFLVKGPEISDFTEGYFIGKIMHDPEYPFKPPNFMMLTPNGPKAGPNGGPAEAAPPVTSDDTFCGLPCLSV